MPGESCYKCGVAFFLDVPLSTGVYDVILDSTKLNSISFKWDPNKECGVFVKVSGPIKTIPTLTKETK